MVINGLVYEIRKEKNYIEKILKGCENHLDFNINIETTETSRIVTGTIYKKHYKNGIVELNNKVKLIFGNYDNIIELIPDDGMIDINIEIPFDITSMIVNEKNTLNVNGIYDFKEV